MVDELTIKLINYYNYVFSQLFYSVLQEKRKWELEKEEFDRRQV